MSLKWTFWDIVGHFGTFGDNSEEFGAFRLFSYSFPTIFFHNRLNEKQVRSNNDASEVDILGHFGTFWDILGHFGIFLDSVELKNLQR